MQTNSQNRRQFLSRMASASAGVGAVLGRATFVSAEQKSLTTRSKPIGDPDVPLEVILLGTGSPGIVLDEQRGGACEIVLAYGEPLLFDLGHLGLTHLVQAGLHPNDIRRVFFTHTYHYDHFCDFDGFMQIRALRRAPRQRPNTQSGQRPPRKPTRQATQQPVGGAGPLYVYGPADTKDRIDLVLRQVYAEDIRAKNLVRRDVVKVQVADEGIACESEKWKVASTHVKHGPNALGYRIDAGGKSVAISGDVAEPSKDPNRPGRIVGFPCESMERLARGTDLFIIDACGRHSTPKELAAAVVRANPKKVVLTHVQSTASGIVYHDTMKEVYEGEVIIAKNLMRIRV